MAIRTHRFRAVVVHLFYNISDYDVGVFYGMAGTDHQSGGDTADVTWYGLEMARDFGQYSIAAQIGLADSDNSHSSIDFANEFMFGAEASYDHDSDLTFVGGLASSGGEIHSDTDFKFTNVWVEASYDIGSTDFESFARVDYYIATGDGEVDNDRLTEASITLGFRYEFGNQASTPMMDSMIPAYTALATSTYDEAV